MTDASASAVPVALCLGGMDPSGGAGILRDITTLAALGIPAMAVSTADTVQNGLGCLAIHAPRDPLAALEALTPHLAGPWGVKLGLCTLGVDALRPLAELLERQEPLARIWDPIQAPTSGVGLHGAGDLRALAALLLGSGPWVVAPNLPEASALTGLPPEADPGELAAPLLALGAAAVWLKGGHGARDRVEDFWITREGCESLGRFPRLPGDRRGTGCTLASAWLGFRLQGLAAREAALAAGSFLRAHWEPGLRLGQAGRPCFAPMGGRP